MVEARVCRIMIHSISILQHHPPEDLSAPLLASTSSTWAPTAYQATSAVLATLCHPDLIRRPLTFIPLVQLHSTSTARSHHTSLKAQHGCDPRRSSYASSLITTHAHATTTSKCLPPSCPTRWTKHPLPFDRSSPNNSSKSSKKGNELLDPSESRSGDLPNLDHSPTLQSLSSRPRLPFENPSDEFPKMTRQSQTRSPPFEPPSMSAASHSTCHPKTRSRPTLAVLSPVFLYLQSWILPIYMVHLHLCFPEDLEVWIILEHAPTYIIPPWLRPLLTLLPLPGEALQSQDGGVLPTTC